MKYKSKAGTVGRTIETLVRKHGGTTMGIFVLEMALKEACGVPRALVTLNGENVGRTPGYVTAEAKDNALLARVYVNRPLET